MEFACGEFDRVKGLSLSRGEDRRNRKQYYNDKWGDAPKWKVHDINIIPSNDDRARLFCLVGKFRRSVEHTRSASRPGKCINHLIAFLSVSLGRLLYRLSLLAQE